MVKSAFFDKSQTILHEEEMIVPVFISNPRKRNDVAMLLETHTTVVGTRILLGETI